MNLVKPTYKHATSLWLCIRNSKKRPKVMRDYEDNLVFQWRAGANSYCRMLVESLPQFLRGDHREEARVKIAEWFGIDTNLAAPISEIEKVSEPVMRRVQSLPIEFRERAERRGLNGDSLGLACDAFNATLAGMIANSEIKGT